MLKNKYAFIIITNFFILFDQCTKIVARYKGDAIYNTGVAFGFLSTDITRYIVIAITGAYLGLLVYNYNNIKDNIYKYPFILITAGAVGNLIDRVWFGQVIDFIQVSWLPFPAFNVADMLLTVGTIMLVYIIFLRSIDDKSQLVTE